MFLDFSVQILYCILHSLLRHLTHTLKLKKQKLNNKKIEPLLFMKYWFELIFFVNKRIILIETHFYINGTAQFQTNLEQVIY